MDKGFAILKRWVGACASNAQVEGIKAALEKAEKVAYLPKTKSLFSKNSEAFDKFTRATEALGKIKEGIDKAQNVCLDLQAIGRIHDAIKVLDDETVIWNDPDKAAKAFGDLFVGVGRFARYLPEPFNEYGTFLESAGDFFVDMNRAFKPSTRPSYREQWQQIDWEYAGGK